LIFFVAPAYNEEKNVPRLIRKIDDHCKGASLDYRLVIVDDGSRDRTAEVVRAEGAGKPCELITYTPNKGVDEAFRRGLTHALEIATDADVIVTLEADGTSDLGILPDFLEKIRGGADLVVASYYAPGGEVRGTVWHRKLLSKSANLLIRAVFKLEGVRTYSSFFRAYRPSALRSTVAKYGELYRAKGFACVLELLIRIHRAGFRVTEVPMVLKGDERVGKSKMKVAKTTVDYLKVIGRNALSA